jgi:hypothetical protein
MNTANFREAMREIDLDFKRRRGHDPHETCHALSRHPEGRA